jgi:hypothetical protein
MTTPPAHTTCPGWRHEGTWSYDALGQPRCCNCGYSWYTHKNLGIPHPSEPPPDADLDGPLMAWLKQEDDDDDGQTAGDPGE